VVAGGKAGAALAIGVCFASLARAQGARGPDAMADTPRAALLAFLEDARAGREQGAAVAFGPMHAGADPGTLARRLRAVLDHLRVDPERVSDRPEGRRDDGLPDDVDEIASVPTAHGRDPVRMLRLPTGRWVFTPATLARVSDWYAALPNRLLLDRLPQPLLGLGPRELSWWQWLALPVLVLLSLGLGRLFAWPLAAGLRAVARRTDSPLDDKFVERITGPLILVCADAAAWGLTSMLDAGPTGRGFVGTLLEATLLVAFFWAILRSIDLAVERARASPFVATHPSSAALLPLGSKVAKIVLGVAAVVVVLQRLGYPAASLVAGLGIGGLAVALAAQKTVENLFGSVTLGIDQPFRPGDFVQVEGLMGTVENVGLRSTRIRTPDRTLVTVPNGRLADQRIETFAARDRIRFACDLPLALATTCAQARAVVDEVRARLLAEPDVVPADVSVFVKALGQNGVVVEAVATFRTVEWSARFLPLRQELLLAMMEIVAKNGTALAMPVVAVPAAKS